MQTRRGINKVLVLGAIFLWFWLPAAAGAEVLEIPGTGACEVLLQELAAAFNARHPEHRVLVPRSIGTAGALRLVTSDRAEMGRVGRPLTKGEKDQGLTYLALAQDLVVFAVGAKAPVKNITTLQLVEVYTGKVTDWQTLGGPRAPIRLLLRESVDSSLVVIEKHLEAFRNIHFDPVGKVTYSDHNMLLLLQKYDYAIGWLTSSSLKGAKTPVYALALDGVPPTPENARAGRYQLLSEYALVFKEKRLTDLARLFLGFILSIEGQGVMEQSGVIPIP